MTSAKSDYEKSGNKAAGDNKAKEQIRTSTPNGGTHGLEVRKERGNRSGMMSSLESRWQQTEHTSVPKGTLPSKERAG